MVLTLISAQFEFEEGQARFLYSHPEPALLDSEPTDAIRLRQNVVGDVYGLRAGPVTLLLSDCLVKAHRSGIVRRIPLLILNTSIDRSDIECGRADVPVGPHAFVRVQISTPRSGPDGASNVVGIATQQGTLEGDVGAGGALEALLPSERHYAYFIASPQHGIWFEIEAGVDDAGTIELALPG